MWVGCFVLFSFFVVVVICQIFNHFFPESDAFSLSLFFFLPLIPHQSSAAATTFSKLSTPLTSPRSTRPTPTTSTTCGRPAMPARARPAIISQHAQPAMLALIQQTLAHAHVSPVSVRHQHRLRAPQVRTTAPSARTASAMAMATACLTTSLCPCATATLCTCGQIAVLCPG